ncbi:MAG: hypothetical protein ABIQ30_13115 [Devosia sp.]
MYSDSRKAQRNSFAHHRAQLLFTQQEAKAGGTPEWATTVHQGADPTEKLAALSRQIRAGLRGFVPASVAAA